MTDQPLTEIFSKIMDLCLVLGVQDIKSLPGAWEYEFDSYIIALNGHPETIKVKEYPIDPYRAAVWWGGWQVPFIDASPFDGIVFGGQSEDNFLIDIQKEIVRLGEQPK